MRPQQNSLVEGLINDTALEILKNNMDQLTDQW